jgi:GR25 family glycosyltransferase involved in LPS biosynthesis
MFRTIALPRPPSSTTRRQLTSAVSLSLSLACLLTVTLSLSLLWTSRGTLIRPSFSPSYNRTPGESFSLSLPLIDPPADDNCTTVDAPPLGEGVVLSSLGVFQLQIPGTKVIDPVRFEGAAEVRRAIEDDLGLVVHVVDGVNASTLTVDPDAGHVLIGAGEAAHNVSHLVSPGLTVAGGRLGATLSHVLLLQYLLTLDHYEYFLVLEDDAILCKNWATRLGRYLAHLPSDVELARVYIDPFTGGRRAELDIEYETSRRNRVCGNPYTSICTGQYGQIAHIFTRSGITKVLAATLPIKTRPIDTAVLRATRAGNLATYIPFADEDALCFAISHPVATGSADAAVQTPLVLAGPLERTSVTRLDNFTVPISHSHELTAETDKVVDQ